MKRNQSAEDYLETILILSKELEFVHQIEVARRLGVSQPAVQKALKLLKERGLAETDGLHIYLTQRGRESAEEVYHRHCVLREFLQSLGVEEEQAEEDACEMEHVISQTSFNAIEKLLNEIKKQP